MIGEVLIIGLQLAILAGISNKDEKNVSKDSHKKLGKTGVAERRQAVVNSDNERVVPVPLNGYQSAYKVSDLGVVTRNGRILKTSLKSGKPYVTLSNSTHSTTFTVERLVALAFLVRPAKGDELHHRILHKNGNINDNRAVNLMWK